MRQTIINTSALLASMSILLLANGLQGTLVGVRVRIEEFPDSLTGLIMSAFFVGYILSFMYSPRIVKRVGHIRAFAVLASLASAVALTHALFVNPWLWLIFRVLTGGCVAGLYMVVESWLNSSIDNQSRGRFMAIYMILNLGSVALGQQLLNLAPPEGMSLFIVGSILFSIALVPVGLTTTNAPPINVTRPLTIKKLHAMSPLGMVGSFMAGLSNGAFWGMAPAYAYDMGMTTPQIATLMSVIVFGGMALQWPIGRLSDHVDRRSVILLASMVLTLMAMVLSWILPDNLIIFYGVAFLFGGFLLSINGLCMAHMNDQIDPEDMVQASSSLLLLFGIGAAFGPFVAAMVMAAGEPAHLFSTIAAISMVLVAFGAYRTIVKEAPSPQEQTPFRPMFGLSPRRWREFSVKQTSSRLSRQAKETAKKTVKATLEKTVKKAAKTKL